MLFFYERYAKKTKKIRERSFWPERSGGLMSELTVKIVVKLIWKLFLWTLSLIIRGFLNEYLPVFFSKTRKELEDIISSDEIDENDKVIDSFRKKTIIKKLIVKELLIQKVQYANSKGRKKEINAVTLLSLILPIEESLAILKIFIEDKHIDMRISKAAVYKLKNILLREGLKDKDKKT